MNDVNPPQIPGQAGTDQNEVQFRALKPTDDEYTDGRKLWDWQSKYPADARSCVKVETWCLGIFLLVFVCSEGIAMGMAGQTLQIQIDWLHRSVDGGPAMLSIDMRMVAIYLAGSVGGTTFSIKWLIHALAKGRWHLDRRHWRLFVPFVGGVYACVVLTLFDGGFIGGGNVPVEPRPVSIALAFAFLVGYFSDGVSGLLSNIANAVFGTLKK